MTEIWALAALWLGLALLAPLLSIWLKVANALSEILVGTAAQLVLGAAFGAAFLGADQRSEEHTSELQSHVNLVCRLLLEKKNINEHWWSGLLRQVDRANGGAP